MNRMTIWLWFEDGADEAASFYASVFRDASPGEVVRAAGGGEPRTREGQVLTASFSIGGQTFVCLNGGPHAEAKPNDAVSFQIQCADQAELDEYWDKLTSNGGRAVQCGWLKDRYGFSWQIVPEMLGKLLNGPDRDRAKRVTTAMMKMVKLDVAALEAA